MVTFQSISKSWYFNIKTTLREQCIWSIEEHWKILRNNSGKVQEWKESAKISAGGI